jgi:hypothetical protein
LHIAANFKVFNLKSPNKVQLISAASSAPSWWRAYWCARVAECQLPRVFLCMLGFIFILKLLNAIIGEKMGKKIGAPTFGTSAAKCFKAKMPVFSSFLFFPFYSAPRYCFNYFRRCQAQITAENDQIFKCFPDVAHDTSSTSCL